MIDETPVSNGLRRLVEGDVGAELHRMLRKDGIEVEVIPSYDQGYGEFETGWRSPVAKRSKRNG